MMPIISGWRRYYLSSLSGFSTQGATCQVFSGTSVMSRPTCPKWLSPAIVSWFAHSLIPQYCPCSFQPCQLLCVQSLWTPAFQQESQLELQQGWVLSWSQIQHCRFGVAESPSSTSYLGRLNADNDAVSATLSALASSIEHPPFLIRDCRRLGRYQPDSPKQRPLLVTMNSTVEVSTVLSSCHKLSASISIRPDLTQSERQERGILLRERRRLIDAGVSRDIKLKRSELYVSGTLTGRVVNS